MGTAVGAAARPRANVFGLGRLALRVELPLVLLVAVAAVVVGRYTVAVTDWAVMSDELLYERLAISFAQTLSPVPTVHGEHIAFYSMLYPALIAPLYGLLGMPAAFQAVHVWNAVLMTSAAVPAFLLARAVLPERRLSPYVVAALTVAVPWLVLSAFVLSEVAAYPAFLWAVLALQRALAEPSARRDLLALAALGVAFLARTQLVVLAALFPLAALVHELGYALAAERGRRLDALRNAGRSALRAHRVAVAAYLLGALLFVLLLLVASPADVLGSYAGTVERGVLPSGIWRAAPAHLAVVVFAVGFLPFVLGGAWALATLRRPAGKGGHAFAVLALLLVAALTLQVASFDLRTADPGLVRDRYLFYVAPLLFVAMLACALEPRRAWILAGVLGAGFAVAITQVEFPLFLRLEPDTVASAANRVVRGRALQVGSWVGIQNLGPGPLLATLAGVATAAVVVGLARLPRTLVVACAVVPTLAFCMAETGYTFERLASSDSPSGRPMRSGRIPRAWIDRAVPDAETVAIMPFSIATDWGSSAILWWDQEFWNERVNRAYLDEHATFAYTPDTFDAPRLRFDLATGRAGTGSPPQYLVQAAADPRFKPVGKQVAKQFELELVAVESPLRARWITRGLDLDGWTLAGRRAVVRVFGDGRARRVHRVEVGLSSPPLRKRRRYRLETAGAVRSGAVASTGFVAVRIPVCVPHSGHADVVVRVRGSTTIPAVPLNPPQFESGSPRRVGLRLGPIRSVATGARC